ncbi:MAG: chemotaxis protein CheX, partial [Calditrichae bacterium]|nr:chemotaxis protein CheX [Calditrichia bacterium]NIW78256.1 chemotaxis protein CheX [Calditrichia bacterium]
VMGEITNMVAGNVKSLLPMPCAISLPSVAITDYDLHHPRSQPITTVNFNCEGIDFLVTMLEEG